MVQNNLIIEGIPAVLWGEKSDSLYIAIHGNMSNKTDEIIRIFAEQAVKKEYQILSFDLPNHGERKSENDDCSVQNCVRDLKIIMKHSQTSAKNISIFGSSMGAYFSLLTYTDIHLKQALFLSPIVNMTRIIENLMKYSNVTLDRLMIEKEIPTNFGQTLYLDYFNYVLAHPIKIWNIPTCILYGQNDNLSEFDMIKDFSNRFEADLCIMKNGEHYFHTEEQLSFFKNWLIKKIF